jgi:hypothetical protein
VICVSKCGTKKTPNKANIPPFVWSGFLFPHHFEEAASLPIQPFSPVEDIDARLRQLTDIDLATVTNPSAHFEAMTDVFLSSMD